MCLGESSCQAIGWSVVLCGVVSGGFVFVADEFRDDTGVCVAGERPFGSAVAGAGPVVDALSEGGPGVGAEGDAAGAVGEGQFPCGFDEVGVDVFAVVVVESVGDEPCCEGFGVLDVMQCQLPGEHWC